MRRTLLKNPGIAHFLLLFAVILGIVELGLYLLYGRTSFDPNYSLYAIAGMGAGILFGLIGLFSGLRAFAFLSYLAFLYGFIHLVVSQINLIANILYGVDGSTFPVTFYVMMGAAFLSFVLALLSGVTMKQKSKEVQNETEE
ncbi:MAG: hypothetical protein J6U26_06455 [Lachnospiraceae bacterium]|nr:hypothetical protein [Lachnospiraceae bacterium]